MLDMPTKKQKISGIEYVKKFINSLPLDEQVDALHVLENLENGEFDKVFCKNWRGKIKEVYFKRNNRFFFVKNGNTIQLLYACRKQKNKTEKQDAYIILKRAKEL